MFRTPSEMQAWSRDRRREGKTIGCVPTMGALHDGHLSLIRASAAGCDETIVTIFVNPTQFGPDEDLGKYPRDEASDLKLAVAAGATSAYCPAVEVMYPENSSVHVVEVNISTGLCGESRPFHFRGVTTVVSKLFNACLPDRAYFGMKDYQQLLVLRRMVRDLDFLLEIVGCPIVREPDGLAMSSRNKYLTDKARVDALCLRKGLDIAEQAFENGIRDPKVIGEMVRDSIKQVESAEIDYIECRDAEDLSEIETIENPAVVALAVTIGKTRLIDNTVLSPDKERKDV